MLNPEAIDASGNKQKMKMTGSAPPTPAFRPDVPPAAAASTRATFAISHDAMHDATNHDLTSVCSLFEVIGRVRCIVKPLKAVKAPMAKRQRIHHCLCCSPGRNGSGAPAPQIFTMSKVKLSHIKKKVDAMCVSPCKTAAGY